MSAALIAYRSLNSHLCYHVARTFNLSSNEQLHVARNAKVRKRKRAGDITCAGEEALKSLRGETRAWWPKSRAGSLSFLCTAPLFLNENTHLT